MEYHMYDSWYDVTVADSPIYSSSHSTLSHLYRYKCDREECDEEYIGESARTFGERYKEHLKCPSLIYGCIQCILWSLCNRLATSFINVSTRSLWSVLILTSWVKKYWWNFSKPCSMPRSSLSILQYQVSALVRLLLANAIDCSVSLVGTAFLGNTIVSFNGRRLTPRPTPSASVSRHNHSFSL